MTTLQSVPRPTRGVVNPVAGEKKFRLERYRPDADLAPFIEHFWLVAWSLPEGVVHVMHDAFLECMGNNPRAGDIVPQSGGIRKISWVRPGIDKSSGVRVIYFTRNAEQEIDLLAIYARAVTGNQHAAQLKELRRDYEKIFTFKR
ncbi:DUF6597 domain-containing transcriptional factor [Duganella sp. BuS-21]|uniref:DUF6597 domain-containing transcriptional factor n=1 Tax=Duganella sp. BuS-21 TaxID=2943848 RepID=UPI0035A69BB5